MVRPLVPLESLETRADREAAPEHALVCRRCDHAITTESARTSCSGSHVHTRINPGGWVHEFGCFSQAPGCRAGGSATTEATWFPPHAWRIALCGSCGEHLGWRFEGPSLFFGLLLDRLRGA